MNPEKVLCKCRNVTKGDILSAMGKGASTFKEISKITGAGTKCGHCKEEVKHFIKKHRKAAGAAGAGKPSGEASGETE
jgi:bacterioferritin-associated ferredoxin